MASFLDAFWATPRMTVGHLVFALGMTIYIPRSEGPLAPENHQIEQIFTTA